MDQITTSATPNVVMDADVYDALSYREQQRVPVTCIPDHQLAFEIAEWEHCMEDDFYLTSEQKVRYDHLVTERAMRREHREVALMTLDDIPF